MDIAGIEDLFAPLGSVHVRRMFGGMGIYHEGLIVALVVHDEILLKADTVTAPLFMASGARQWSYARDDGAPVAMPYWSIPEEAADDPDVLLVWLRRAAEAAARAPRKAVRMTRRAPAETSRRRAKPVQP